MNRRILLSALFAVPLLAAVSSAHAGGHGGGGGEKKKGGGPGFTQFPMINVFTSANGARHGSLSLDMGLYSSDAKMVDRIKLYMPRLRDAYISRLQGYASNLSSSTMVDADYVETQLQTATDTVLGQKGAKVLIGSILLN